MFISKNFYERAPYYWMVLGVLLVLVGTYLGANVDPIYYFMGLGGGALSCGWGLWIFRQRLATKNRQVCDTYDEYLSQTMELNLQKIRESEESA
jgi:hypothetical protein